MKISKGTKATILTLLLVMSFVVLFTLGGFLYAAYPVATGIVFLFVLLPVAFLCFRDSIMDNIKEDEED